MYKLTAIFLIFFFTSPIQAEELSDEEQLLAFHKEGIEAHKGIGLDKWLDGFGEGFISANRGEISYPTPQQMKDRLGPYIRATEFEYYRDMVPPIVRVSDDGTLGWVIVQVEAKGVQAGQEIAFQYAWIELYEKKDGQWIRSGNVSNIKG